MNLMSVGAGLLGAALCAAAAFAAAKSARTTTSHDEKIGAMLLAFGLILQAAGAWFLNGSGGTPSIVPGAILCAAMVCLLLGFVYVAARPVRETLCLLLDSCVGGASIAAVVWWIKLESLASAAARNGTAKLLLTAALFALIAAIAGAGGAQKSTGAARITRVAACGGAVCIAIALYGFWGAPGAGRALWPSLLLSAGALLIGAGTFAAQRSATPQDNRSAIEIGPVLAVCLALLVSTLHGAGHNSAWGEAWWAPVLAMIAIARFALLGNGKSTPEFGRTFGDENAALRESLTRRTHQLSTLHAITADLNNTLDCEKLLVNALEQMHEAVDADAGAVWLLAGASGMGIHNLAGDAGALGNASALLREIERSAAERRAIESLKVGRDSDGISNGVAGHENLPTFQRWRLVHAAGAHADATNLVQNLHAALERGGPDDGASLSAANDAAAHVAAIRWKGEIIGAMGAVRLRNDWESAERTLLDALALEVGVALQNAQLYQEASRLADRDGLTDLLNHRAVQQQLNAILSRAKRVPTEFSVVIMDVKNFGFFNDTYGHPVGDRVLRTVANCLRDACRRPSDVLGRFGGDEFIAILLDTDAEGTNQVCTRIAKRIEQESFQAPGDGRRIPIGLSFGAALYPDDGSAALDLMALANSNLAESKSGGTPFVLQSDKAKQKRELRQLKDVAVAGSFGVLDALVTAIDNKDHYTRRHSEDVSHWATLMSAQLGHDEDTQRAVRICGLLHDVGKIAVPDSILRKPGRLEDDEFHIMQQHPVFGALIVKDVPNLNEVLGGVRHHHERFDGKGYPDKMSGEDIPLLGRILAVPDCFSAMTTERPYRKALSWAEAISEIEKGRGTQFDPQMADAFLEVIARLIAAQNETQEGGADENQAALKLSHDAAILRPRSVADAEPVA